MYVKLCIKVLFLYIQKNNARQNWIPLSDGYIQNIPWIYPMSHPVWTAKVQRAQYNNNNNNIGIL